MKQYVNVIGFRHSIVYVESSDCDKRFQVAVRSQRGF